MSKIKDVSVVFLIVLIKLKTECKVADIIGNECKGSVSCGQGNNSEIFNSLVRLQDFSDLNHNLGGTQLQERNINNSLRFESEKFDLPEESNEDGNNRLIPAKHINLVESKSRGDILETTKPEDNPYAVLLFNFDEHGERVGLPSTGNLITDQWVLTAAYCLKFVTPVRTVTVYAGGNNAREFVEKTLPPGSQAINSSAIHIHPEYRRDDHGFSFNDIALVKTRSKFTLTTTVNTIRLSFDPWDIAKFTECRVTGFGQVYKYASDPKDFTRKTYYLQVKNPCYCLTKTDRDLDYLGYKRWLCTWPVRNYPYGVCEGDFGGGLVYNGKLRAVTSPLVFVDSPKSCHLKVVKHFECGDKNALTIFQNICPYINWINGYVRISDNKYASGQCLSVASKLSSSLNILLFSVSLVVCFNVF